MAFMAPIMGALSAAGGTMGTLGTVLSLGGAAVSAISGMRAAKAEQAQLDIKAGQEEAAAQRRAVAARDKSAIMMSRALAVGAASGAGTSGIEGLMMDLAGRGEEAAGAEIYEGKEKANSLRYAGKVGVSQARSGAFATMLGAAGQAATSIAGRFAPSPAPTLSYGYSEGDGFGKTSQIW